MMERSAKSYKAYTGRGSFLEKLLLHTIAHPNII
jgi:hypothetical protein